MQVSKDILLEINNLSAGYYKKNIIDNINLQLNKGEIAAVLGTNGAGKSTLFKAIFRLMDKVNGKIIFNNHDISHASPSQIVKYGISYLLQINNIFENLTVIDNLTLFNKERNIKKLLDKYIDILPASLNYFSDRNFLNKRAGLLSGGERQTIAIFMILLREPQLILMDEPTAGLSPKIVYDLIGFIREININHGISFLIIEQNIKAVIDITDKIFVMKKGNIILSNEFSKLNLNDKLEEIFFN